MSYEDPSRAAAEALTRACNASSDRCPVCTSGCPFGRTLCDRVDVDDWLSRIQIDIRRERFYSC